MEMLKPVFANLPRPVGTREISVSQHGGFKGLYQTISPVGRPLGALSRCVNLVLLGNMLTVRPPTEPLGPAVAEAPVTGMHAFYEPVSGVSQLLVGAGTFLKRYNNGAWTTITDTFPTAKWTAANIADIAVIFNGSTPLKWNGTSLSTLANAPQAKYVVSAYERLFVAGMADRPMILDYCDILLPENWTPGPHSEAGSINVGSHEGDYITWLGFDKAQGKVVIWTRYSLTILFGPETGNRHTLWAVTLVSPHGTMNGRTVQRLGKTWLWLADEGVAFWSGGDVQIVRDPIRDCLADIDWNRIAEAQSGLDHEGRYLLFLPSKSGTDFLLVYDGTWTTFEDISLTAFARFNLVSEEVSFWGTSGGTVEQFSTGGVVGNVFWEALIGPATLGEPASLDRIRRAYLVVSKNVGTVVSVQVSMNGGLMWSREQLLEPSARLNRHRLLLQFPDVEGGISFLCRLRGQGQATIHDIKLVFSESRF